MGRGANCNPRRHDPTSPGCGFVPKLRPQNGEQHEETTRLGTWFVSVPIQSRRRGAFIGSSIKPPQPRMPSLRASCQHRGSTQLSDLREPNLQGGMGRSSEKRSGTPPSARKVKEGRQPFSSLPPSFRRLCTGSSTPLPLSKR